MLATLEGGEQLEALVNKGGIVFVDFWAEWCAPCKQFGVIYERVAADIPDVDFAKVNVELHPELSQPFQIQSIPHLVVFKDGVIIYSETGSMPESALRELVKQAQVVDIEKTE